MSQNNAGKANKFEAVMDAVGTIIFGKKTQIREIMLTFLAGGNVLLEDIPGVGKTAAALAFTKALGLNSKRIQFTPDVLPSDVTGYSIYQKGTGSFVFREGAVFTNLLLADELNRTSPKTQSALLEARQEKQVSVEGETRSLPRPFYVIATENPRGSTGTQSLPESQLDRFMTGFSFGYPDYDSELQIVQGRGSEALLSEMRPVLSPEDLLSAVLEVKKVYIKDNAARYIVDLIRATREHPGIAEGGSPRATIALGAMAKASAFLEGRDYVTYADISSQFPYIIRHRIILGESARLSQSSKEDIIRNILSSVKKPSLTGRTR